MNAGPHSGPGETPDEAASQAASSTGATQGETGTGGAPAEGELYAEDASEASGNGEPAWEDEYADEGDLPYEEGYWPGEESYAYSDLDTEPPYYTYTPPERDLHAKQARPAGPWPRLVMVTAVAVVAAAVALAVTAPKSSRPLAQNTGPGTTAGTVRTSAKPTSTTIAPTSTTPRRTTTTAAHRRQLAKNLIISAATKQSLVTTWLSTNPGGQGISAKDVAGTAPGQVYYAYDVSISTYFAVAAFQPSSALLKQARTATGKAKLRQFQDYDYVFSLQTGSTWTLLGVVPKGYCPGEWVPAPVLTVWGMCGYSART
jgi:hypothetical protein